MFDHDSNVPPADDSDATSGGSGYESIEPIEFEPTTGGTTAGFGGHRWLLFASFAFLFLLAVFAWYMFTSHSVLIDFDPPTEEVTLEGGLLEIELGERWLLRPGEYRVGARLEGYYDFDQMVTIEDIPDQEFLFHLTKLPGFLNVRTDPEVPGARVWIDGSPIGPAPLDRHELRPGDYQITVLADRYHDFELPIAIEGGHVEQQIAAALEPAWADVYVPSTPAGATLYVDGEPMGETPITAEILEGNRSLELRLDSYKDWSLDLQIVAQQNVDVPMVMLEKADTIVRVSSIPGGASVTVDGEYRGQAPMELALAPGEQYRIGFAKAGYQSNQRVLDVVSGDETRLQVRLQAIVGEVLIAGSPADAEVLVDGIPRGMVNERMRLPAHPHRIEVKKEGYESFSTTVTPNPQLEQRIEVALKSFEAIKKSRTPDIWVASTGHRLKLVRPAGIFRLGSGRREQGRRSNEFMRQVQLQRPFYVGLKEVTNEEFWAHNPQHDSGVVERQTLSLKKQPAVRLTWDQAARYCNWLSQQEGLPAAYQERDGTMVAVEPMNTGYRLPTEAEWAYAARYEGQSEGRAALKYPWGTGMPPEQQSGNFAGSEAALLVQRALQSYRDEHPATAQVGTYTPSGLGLYDMGGNVREWMHDYYVIHTGGLGSIPVDPMGPRSGESHVIRGSSWRSASITELRLAFRDDGVEATDDIGFRIARYAE